MEKKKEAYEISFKDILELENERTRNNGSCLSLYEGWVSYEKNL